MNQNGSATKTGYPVRYFDQVASSSSSQIEQHNAAYGTFVAYPPTTAYMQNQTIVAQQFDNSYNQALTDYASNQYFNQQYQQHSSTPLNKIIKRNIKKKTPYNKPTNSHIYYCELCKISCAGEQPYKLHCEGQKHRKKELSSQNVSSNGIANGAATVSNQQKSNYFCELCSVPCSGVDSYNAHLKGKSHIRACNLQVKLGKAVPADLVTPLLNQSDNVVKTTVNPFASVLAAAAAARLQQPTKTNRTNDIQSVKVIGTPQINFVKGGSLKTMTSDSDAVIEKCRDEKTDETSAAEQQPIVQQTDQNETTANESVLENNESAVTMNETNSLNEDSTTAIEIPLLGEPLETSKLNNVDLISGEPIGEEFICEFTMANSKAIFYSCSLCNCKFSEIMAKEQHVRGKRHHKNYKSQNQSATKLTTRSPIIKPLSSNNKSLYSKSPLFNRSLNTGPKGKPPSFSELLPDKRPSDQSSLSAGNHSMNSSFTNQSCDGSIRMNQSTNSTNDLNDEMPEFRENMDLSIVENVEPKYQSTDNRYLFKKHSEIVPREDDLKQFYKHISNVEKTLKHISDDFLRNPDLLEDVHLGVSLGSDSRILQGEIRAGLFGKKLMLRDENQIDLIMFCSVKPTIPLLRKLVEILSSKLKYYQDEQYVVSENIEEAAIDVKANNQTVIRVTLTSLIIRNVNIPSNAQPDDFKDPEQMLDRQKCLDALTALRRFKWYQAKVAPFNPCPMIIRLLRDLTKRVDAWRCLTSWSLELICERVMSNCLSRPAPAEAFRLILQTLGSGVLINERESDILIVDPCEIEPIDSLGYLTNKQRVEITESAQTMVQFMTFNKIYKILDTDIIQVDEKSEINLETPLQTTIEKNVETNCDNEKEKSDEPIET